MIQISLGEELEVVSLGLGGGGGSGKTITLNGEVVTVHGHVEEAVITPVGTPRVATNPVLLTSLGVLTIADD